MKKKIMLLPIFLLMAGNVYAMEIGGAHADMDMSCADCHQVDAPEKAPTTNNCLECHDSYEELIKATAPTNIDPDDEESRANPHDSHMGLLDCIECHKTHVPSEFVCAECHMFDMEPK